MGNIDTIETATENNTERKTQSSSMGLLDYLVLFFMSVLTSMAVISGYHYLFTQQTPTIAVVDVNELVELKQLAVSAQAITAKKTEKTAQDIYEQITSFTNKLEQEIANIQEDCGCVLIVRPAVIKSKTTVDYTDALKQHLGIDGLNRDELIKQITSAGGNDPEHTFGKE